MKNQTHTPELPLKRQPVKKDRVFRRIFGKTGNSITRSRADVGFADPSVLEGDVPNMNVGRAMVVIVVIHIICLVGYFLREKIVRDRQLTTTDAAAETNVTPSFASATISGVDSLPQIRQGDRTHLVKSETETYASIAEFFGISEPVLREANGDVKLVKGLNLRVPPRTAAAVIPEELDRLKNPQRTDVVASNSQTQKSSMIDEAPPKAHPVISHEKTHQVKKGETLYSIAKIYGVSINDLVKANQIKNAAALRIGTALKVPSR
jgi:LysM repeat protein